jgi:hypothetical protein
MKKLRFELYSGFEGDRTYSEKDVWYQAEGDTIEEIAEFIKLRVIENGETLLSEEGDDE